MAEENTPSTPVSDGSKTVPPKNSSSNKTLIIVLAVVAVIVILPVIVFSIFAFWLSRGDNANNLTEGIIESTTGADVEVNENGSSFNIETDEGSISVGEQELPKDLPSAVVVYENQKVVSVITNNQEGAKVWSFTSESSDDATKVNEYLVTKFAENGWTTVSTSTYNTTTSYSLTKDNLTAQVSVTSGENGDPTTLTYYISEE
jgi:hypothetical protein